MFERSVQRVFSAAHAIVMRGERDPLRNELREHCFIQLLQLAATAAPEVAAGRHGAVRSGLH